MLKGEMGISNSLFLSLIYNKWKIIGINVQILKHIVTQL